MSGCARGEANIPHCVNSHFSSCTTDDLDEDDEPDRPMRRKSKPVPDTITDEDDEEKPKPSTRRRLRTADMFKGAVGGQVRIL